MKKDPKQVLSKYGTVKTCKVIADKVLTIVITDGFSENAKNSFEFLKTCTDLFPEYKSLETCITENNFAMLVSVKSW